MLVAGFEFGDEFVGHGGGDVAVAGADGVGTFQHLPLLSKSVDAESGRWSGHVSIGVVARFDEVISGGGAGTEGCSHASSINP